jgi:hypothetical protein
MGLGSCFGDLFYALLSLLGMSLLFSFTPVRWVMWLGGGAVLLWLAWKMTRAAWREFHQPSSHAAGHAEDGTPRSSQAEFWRGLLMALASPSSLLWFAAVGGSIIAQSTDGSSLSASVFLSGFSWAAWCGRPFSPGWPVTARSWSATACCCTAMPRLPRCLPIWRWASSSTATRPCYNTAIATTSACHVATITPAAPAPATAGRLGPGSRPRPGCGVVLMHGKGGSPDKHVAGLANALRQQGVLVANLDMPWSGRREYDADVASAVTQVKDALETLRQQGARKLVVAGHSQGGLFALYLAGRLPWMA